MKIVVRNIVTIGFVLGVCPSAQAVRLPYKVEAQKVRGNSTWAVTLRKIPSKRVVWQRKVILRATDFSEHAVTWSRNGRAMAFEYGGGFLVWREGYKLRDFAIPARRYYDWSAGCAWSPDHRRLLIRFGASGMGDSDLGGLFCLKIGAGNRYRYSHVHTSVRKMRWRGNRTVLYWLMDYNTGKTLNKPGVWRAF